MSSRDRSLPRVASESMAPVTTLPPSTFGVSALRSEDPRFLTGRGRYVENLPIEGALRAVFVRSIMPHARLNAVEVAAARAMPGVAGVFTAAAVSYTHLTLPTILLV